MFDVLRLGRFLLVFAGTLGVIVALKMTSATYAEQLPYLFWVGLFFVFWIQNLLVRKWCLK